MNPDQFALYQYVFTERISLLCGTGEPTFDQIEMAKADANQAVAEADIVEAMERIKLKSRDARQHHSPKKPARNIETRNPYAD